MTVAVCLQANFFVWDYGVLDGTGIRWGHFFKQGLIDLSLWILILGVSLIFASWVVRYGVQLGLMVCTLQFAGALAFIAYLPGNWFLGRQPKTAETVFRFSREKNVLFIVLDGFGAPTFERLITRKPVMAEMSDGFTFYKNTVSDFPSTLLSIPAILTGRPFDSSIILGDYFERIFRNESLPVTLRAYGYDSSLVTLQNFCSFLDSEICSGFTMSFRNQQALSRRKESLQLLDLALFRAAPQFLKKRIYNNQRWLLQNMEFLKVRYIGKFDPHLAFVDEFVKKSSALGEQPTFKFYHLLIPHRPIRFDALCNLLPIQAHPSRAAIHDQAECALRFTDRIITRLKELELYEQTMIAIISDHGDKLDYSMYDKKYLAENGLFQCGRLLPLLLIKPFNQHGPLKTSNAPVLLSDLPRTVLSELNIPASVPGEIIFNLASDDAERVRTVHKLALRWGLWRLGAGKETYAGQKRYAVQGNAWDTRSWKVAH